MKVVSSFGTLKNRADHCKVVKRRKRVYLVSKINPRLKVRQGRAKQRING